MYFEVIGDLFGNLSILPKLGYRINYGALYQFDFQFKNVWFHFLNKKLLKVNEDLSILFWLKRQKATKEGLVPIYVRITVKGGRTAFSSGKKIHPDHWDEENSFAMSGCSDSRLINSYITKAKSELKV